jgi:hypothetical protein
LGGSRATQPRAHSRRARRACGACERRGGRGPRAPAPPRRRRETPLSPSLCAPHLPRRLEGQLLEQVGEHAAGFVRHRETGERRAAGKKNRWSEEKSLPFPPLPPSSPPLPPRVHPTRAPSPNKRTERERNGCQAHFTPGDRKTAARASVRVRLPPPLSAPSPRTHTPQTHQTHKPWACGCRAWRPCSGATRRRASSCSGWTTRARPRSCVSRGWRVGWRG